MYKIPQNFHQDRKDKIIPKKNVESFKVWKVTKLQLLSLVKTLITNKIEIRVATTSCEHQKKTTREVITRRLMTTGAATTAPSTTTLTIFVQLRPKSYFVKF